MAHEKKSPVSKPLSRAPRTVRRSESLFIDGVIGCFTFAFDGNILWCNSRVSDLLGIPCADLQGRFLPDLCCETPHGKKKMKKLLERFRKGEAIHDEQLQMCRSDGSPVWVSVNINPTRDESGRIMEGSATITDISEHKKTEEVLKRNFDAQRAIDSILQLSLGDLGVKEVLDRTLELLFLIPWLAVEAKGSIFLIDEDGQLTMVSSYGMSEPILKACSRIPQGFCLCGRAAQTGKVTYAAHIDERHDILYDDITPHGHYCIPMVSRGRVIGILNCYLADSHVRDESEVRFLSSVANVLAGVIERRRAEEALVRSEQYTRSLLRLSKAMEKARSARELVQAAYPEVKEVLGYNSTWIGFGDEEKEELRLLFQQGDVENFVELSTEFKVKGDAWLEEMVRARGPMLCKDARTDPRTDKERVAAEGYRTLLCVPVRLMDSSLVVLCTGTFGDEGVKVPDDEQIRYFASMASSIAVVLDRFRFLEERERAQLALEKSERYTRSLLDLSQAMESARSLHDIIGAAHQEILKIIGYRSAWLGIADEKKEAVEMLSITGDAPKATYNVGSIAVKGDSMMEEIMLGDHPIVVEDARIDPRTDKKMVEALGNRTIINVPRTLMDGSICTLGTGTFLDEGVKIPTEQQIDYLSSMASSIAVVLDRFRFLEGRERAQQEVLKEKNFTELAVKNIPGIFFLDNKKTGMVKWNVNLEKITGHPAKDISKMSLPDFFAGEDREQLRAKVEEMYSQGFARAEASILTREGEKIPFLVTGSLVVLDDDEYVIGTCIDISQRKKAETALKSSEEKYRSLFEESQDVVFISTPDGRFLDVNPAGVRLFGFSSEEDLLKSDMELLYADPGDRVSMGRMIERHGFVSNHELAMKTRAGEPLSVFVTANAVRNEEGRLVAYRGIIRDMTDFRKLEEQLVQAQKMESIGRLAGGLSHDLNNYLTAIQGYTDLAMMELPEDSPVVEDLKEARRSSDRASALTKQLLLFSRREAMEIGPVELNIVVNDLLNMLRQLVGEQFSLRTDLEADLRMINADAGYIEQVIMNLVVNARDAMPEGGDITIGTENVTMDEEYTKKHPGSKPGEFVCLMVRDTGVGMDEEVISRIFEPFFSTKKSGLGTGLGLSVVHGIVSQHGGWIEVLSSPGMGSTFRVYLPVVPPKVRKREEEHLVPADLAGKGERILLVEDDNNVRTLAQKLLQKCGYQVFPAPDAEEALEIFEKESGEFDLVLSDVVLPHKDGIQLVEMLRSRNPGLRVLLMSGYSDEVRWQAIQEGGFAFLRKPFTIPDLKQSIKDLLAHTAK